jgi:putative oxidoreductase
MLATADARGPLAWVCLTLAGLIAAHGWMRFAGGGVAPGRLVPALSAAYASICLAGIATVHAREGGFVVRAGRNGAKHSVLLIVCLLCVGLQHISPRAGH